ncbi:hypothetical protein SAMN06296241_0372 [Salinimicrobium sediminis]|uniref:Uncharacterized protein n=1 Tax=Salinimicrobium sediminis TaxID=1343891 RepID=A0A285X0J8_9FLAO|nr:hypothetical protein [Salinimicrobium sediminis]SOC78855.1 hypothetical protein SAMN06296241_0372 [Salinimicrobium sediminis]
MDLYNTPLLEKTREDKQTAPTIKEAIKGVKLEFYYTGKRFNKYLIELNVCSLIEDHTENLFLRHCTYRGSPEQWKGVIINQVKKQLQDLEVEEGFIKSETRYLEVTPEQHLEKESFENLYRILMVKVNKKKDENNSL